jgi:diguanylate cyclase (GGDEF)-like protein
MALGASEQRRRAVKILVFAVALAGLGLLLSLVASNIWRPVLGGPQVPWGVLLVVFVCTNLLVVHVEFRGDAQTFCLSELPLVVGLLLFNPAELIAARVLGGLIVVVFIDRQTPLKVFFNTSLSWCSTSLLVAVFAGVGALLGAPAGQTPWPAAYCALLAATATDALAISAVIRISGGSIGGAAIRKMLLLGSVSAIAMTSLGLLAVTAAMVTLWAPAFVVVVAAMIYTAFRLSANVTQRYQKLQQLYEFTQILNRSPEFGSAAHAILDEGRELLRSERAELCLRTGDEGRVMRVTLDEQGELGMALQPDDETDPVFVEVVSTGQPVLIQRGSRNTSEIASLGEHAAKDMLMVPLIQGDHVVGTISMLDRLGNVSTFDQEDVKVLATFANHASMALENARLIDELRKEAEDKRHQATHDALTGLANRTLLTERTVEALSRMAVTGGHVGVLLMDLDRFKEINDTLGHHHGDLLLQEVAVRLRAAAPAHATVARLGGDEFSILLPSVGDMDEAVAAAQSISTVFEQPYAVEGLQLTVTGSIGVAVSPTHGTAAPDLMRHADIAMYAAKTQQNPVELYQEEQNEHSARKLALAGALRAAIDEGTLGVHYQPKASLATGDILGVEALCRWEHPDFGRIAPDEFIPLAEHVGLIKPLTTLVLHRALRQLQGWSQAGLHLTMAVNLSVHSLLDAGLPEEISSLLERYDIHPSRLTLEITESEIMRDPERTMVILTGLRDIGVELSIDDFGTGHSSLAYLKRLPVQEVKIDRAFVAQVATNDIDSTIVKSIVEVARNRGLKVVAEGIEDRMTWEVLLELGCDVAQGYYLARPMDGGGTTMWLMKRMDGKRRVAAQSTEELVLGQL